MDPNVAVYHGVLAALGSEGCAVSPSTRERSGLLRFLTDVSALEGVGFPRHQDAGPAAPPEGGDPPPG
jgi:hypothetical protein